MRDTCLKPATGMRAVGARAAGEDMAAEPVPVRRPGVRATGELARAEGSERSEAEYTGSTKIGLSLHRSLHELLS